ncbi:MAG: peptidase [Microbacteriaceae bacterium]|nr:peptidase [Microbacteriaceae bacterium]
MLVETVLLYALGVIVIVIGVAISIGLHEFGHLIPAKLFGVRVGQYMIGFGPTLFSRRRGETEYGVKAIPLGGYISMAGMYPPARKGGVSRTSGTDAFPVESEYESAGRTASTGFFQSLVQDARTASEDTIHQGEENRVFYKLPVWKRITIMLGGTIMNLVIAFVLFTIVLVGIGVAQPTTTVASVSECVIPATSSSTVCSADDPPAAAAAAGIKAGDRIVSIDGTAISTWKQESSVIQGLAGESVPIVVQRDGQRVELGALIGTQQRYVLDSNGKAVVGADGKKKIQDVGFLGIGPTSVNTPLSISTVLPTLGQNIGADFGIIVNLPSRLVQVAHAAFSNEPRDPNGPIGVVGVGRLAGEAAAMTSNPVIDRFQLLLSILASLNVALFAFNMIPLMPLDGGHIAAALWEGIRRGFSRLFKRPDPGPVDIAKLVPLTFAVVIVLGAMSLLLLYADIVKPITLQ